MSILLLLEDSESDRLRKLRSPGYACRIFPTSLRLYLRKSPPRWKETPFWRAAIRREPNRVELRIQQTFKEASLML
jgi:hypothetical protein